MTKTTSVSENLWYFEYFDFIIIGKNKPKAYKIIITKADIRKACIALIFIFINIVFLFVFVER